MLSTMGDVDITIPMLFHFGRTVFPRSVVVTYEGDLATSHRSTYAEVGDRVDRLAVALQGLGVGPGDCVGTLQFNTQAHLEAYFAVPSMGAVLHTLNFRLHPDQLAYIVTHADDRVILVEGFLVPALLAVADRIPTVTHVVVVGVVPDGTVVPETWFDYDTLLDAADPASVRWPAIAERDAMAICYTSGTTGDPKGVAYSHRSTYLHALTFMATFAIDHRDRVLPIVPMFHVNAWGMPYAGWMAGADFLMPGRFLQGGPLSAFINEEHPTFSAGVPTVWGEVLRYAETNPVELSSLRSLVIGGSAVPPSLIAAFKERHGVQVTQAWGMTEISPIGSVAIPPKDVAAEGQPGYRAMTGRPVPGVLLRIADDAGVEVPHDGHSIGEIQARGPWVTTSYLGEPTPEKFATDADGSVWLRTGDVATIDADSFIQITDRAKDVIKSGGEWISSVDLENTLMGHPAVREAAVVSVPDPKWDERPMACVVLRDDVTASVDELVAYLDGRVAKFWIPERWAFIDEVPKTSTLKFDKKVLRARHAAGGLEVLTVGS